MLASAMEMLSFVQENDVKFIRLAFCDLYGRQKNVAITAERLEQVLEHGLRFDGSGLAGFHGAEDLYLHPIPETMCILPWRPQQGRVLRLFCHLHHADGTPFAYDLRRLLENTVKAFQAEGLHCEVGSKASFYLFRNDDQGMPTHTPMDEGGYLDVSPLDKGENVRRETCLMLETMHIATENSLHARGPGQNAIALQHSGALHAADDLITFQSVVSMVASMGGATASFGPTPLAGEAPNWLHMNVSLTQNGQNLCAENTDTWQRFCAGIQQHLPVIQNSCFFPVPGEAKARPAQRTPLVRSPLEAHLQLTFPGAQVNPYLLFALVLQSGLWALKAAPATDFWTFALGGTLAQWLRDPLA